MTQNADVIGNAEIVLSDGGYDKLDAPMDRDVFFTHWFNVSAEDARAWGSEVFKRLWQSGSDARFHMVAWPGNWANGLHYR